MQIETSDLNRSVEQCLTALVDVERRVLSLRQELTETWTQLQNARNVNPAAFAATAPAVMGSPIVQVPAPFATPSYVGAPASILGAAPGVQFVTPPTGSYLGYAGLPRGAFAVIPAVPIQSLQGLQGFQGIPQVQHVTGFAPVAAPGFPGVPLQGLQNLQGFQGIPQVQHVTGFAPVAAPGTYGFLW